MKDNYCHIAVLLDRSGSMQSVRDATIEGLNAFVKLQEETKDIETTVSLTQFDTEYEPNYAFRALKDVVPLNKETYKPRGGTALLDAIGRLIQDTGAALAAMAENLRPSKVLFVIQTDGEENESRKFSKEKVFDMITHQRNNYSWEFIFLGANQDAISSAANLGIAAKSSLSYSGNNTHSTFRTAARYANTAKCCSADDMDKLSFSEADRLAAVAPDNSSQPVVPTSVK